MSRALPSASQSQWKKNKQMLDNKFYRGSSKLNLHWYNTGWCFNIIIKHIQHCSIIIHRFDFGVSTSIHKNIYIPLDGWGCGPLTIVLSIYWPLSHRTTSSLTHHQKHSYLSPAAGWMKQAKLLCNKTDIKSTALRWNVSNLTCISECNLFRLDVNDVPHIAAAHFLDSHCVDFTEPCLSNRNCIYLEIAIYSRIGDQIDCTTFHRVARSRSAGLCIFNGYLGARSGTPQECWVRR